MLLPYTPPLGGGLYIIWLSDTHYYGGRTSSFQRRWRDHYRGLIQGSHENVFMQRVWAQFGRFRPEVLAVIEDAEGQVTAEQAWLDSHFGEPGCLNLTSSSLGGGGPLTPDGRARLSESQSGRVLIFNGDRYKRVPPENLPEWEANGWVSRSPFEGTSWVTREGEEIRASDSDLPRLLKEGWAIGRGCQPTLGSVCVYKGAEKRRPLVEELEDYLIAGWSLGWPFKEPLAWVTRESLERRVPLADLPQWESEGWTRGRVPRAKGTKIWIHRDGKRKKILKPEAAPFLALGWELGTGSHPGPRKVWVHRGKEARRVAPEEAESLVGGGWLPGQGKTGRVWAHNPTTGKIRLCSPEEIPEGWRRGRQ